MGNGRWVIMLTPGGRCHARWPLPVQARWNNKSSGLRRALRPRGRRVRNRRPRRTGRGACPGWRVTNLVLHLGTVHRYVARVIAERLPEPPEEEDLTWLAAPGEYWLTVSSQAGDVNLDR